MTNAAFRECGHNGWQAGCPRCEAEHRLALSLMGEPVEGHRFLGFSEGGEPDEGDDRDDLPVPADVAGDGDSAGRERP